MMLAASTFASYAQHRVKILAEVPVHFGLGYEVNVSKKISLSAQAGVLTEPNSTLVINVLEKFGTSPEIITLIKDSFKFGLVGEAGAHYNFGKNYVGAYSQFINLRGNGTAPDVVEEYFDENFSLFPIRPGSDPSERQVSIRSSLIQAGILYGRRFPLNNEHFEIDTEFGISKNIWSKSRLYSNNRDLSEMDDEVDERLKYYYTKYGYIPSVTVAFVYKFL